MMLAAELRICCALALGVTLGCSSLVLTPRAEDSHAPSEYLAEVRAPAQRCNPPVELLRSAAEVQRPFTELASLSASCYPGTPAVCEQLLLQHACDRQADAVILMPAQAGATPLGASGQSQVSMSGRAVRWTD
jgi:hypothetical protein